MTTPGVERLCKAFPGTHRADWVVWKSLAKTRDRRKLLELANKIMEGHGVEGGFNQDFNHPVGCSYVNMGDTYNTTLILHDSGTITIGCWGDWVESQERRGVHFN